MEARKPKFLNLEEKEKKKHLNSIRRKISKGFYSSEAVAEKISDYLGDIFDECSV
ncbi:MAG: hypothetical protein ACLFQK_04670 [Fibrobacterota bacterium]